MDIKNKQLKEENALLWFWVKILAGLVIGQFIMQLYITYYK